MSAHIKSVGWCRDEAAFVVACYVDRIWFGEGERIGINTIYRQYADHACMPFEWSRIVLQKAVLQTDAALNALERAPLNLWCRDEHVNLLSDPDRARVYFLEAPSAGRVKIGVTTDLESRISALASSSPVPVRLIGSIPATIREERQLHRDLHPFRKHGEWFEDCPSVRAAISGWLGVAA